MLLVVLAGLGDGPPPVMDTMGVHRYLDIQGTYDLAYAWGQRYYAYGVFADDLTDETIDALVNQCGPTGLVIRVSPPPRKAARSPICRSPANGLFGPSRRPSARSRNVSRATTHEDDDRRSTGVAERSRSQSRTTSTCGTSNEVFEDATDLATIYGAEKLHRLVAIKRAWDPGNVFRTNHNVRPDA